ncbi:hypothetical protein EH206_22335 [Brenneria nigrifluens DSM 30175 = ATCC 13028]|uniref:High mobility group protein Z n=1 Tax=Brenneria nigrifluens DSM 30175 = ATCC 13028 TaxID=1121120 RepID=A0A2U1UQU4_9GAMM|nr:hypothetical protein BrE312_4414 [Brenneria sp. EniD312]PWC23974.1 hypothetical protein DDT54_12695 [Brenneria nigrifluens DSM 30175 = ATCC 13028]QCR06646.1 hypothetical protein EH206_22335 [Brenneria nigrifluens DSM 30175 = ATCC 13028]
MKLLFPLLALLVTFYLFCLLGKLWLLSQRKARLHRAAFNRRRMPMTWSGKKRRERFLTSKVSLRDETNKK